MSQYQLIVIGAGPGGYMAALHAAKQGLRTAVVEDREVGGTCLNRGCIPTKTLLHSSRVYREAKEGTAGVCGEGLAFSLPEMFARQREVSQTLRQGIETLFSKAGVTLIRGKGQITAPGRVTVTHADGTQEQLEAEHILAATGSVPARPPIPGLDLPGVMTSDELLQGAEKLYSSIVIIGGGVIGIEFASFYADLGCSVTIIEGLDRLLPNMDRELGQNLALILKKKGVQIYTGAMVQQVEPEEGGLKVSFTVKNTPACAVGEKVLCAIGRRPYLEGLFADGLAPQMDGRRLHVDEYFQTSIPGVYAVGDVSSPVQLAHAATAQGLACVDHLCGRENTVALDLIPGCIYCTPEIAAVGMTEADAKAAGIPAKVGKQVMFGNGRTLIEDPGRCFMKLVAHAETHQLLGAQLMCQHSSDMISQLSQAIANHMTAEQLLRAMRPHPTFEEALTEALEDLVNKLNGTKSRVQETPAM